MRDFLQPLLPRITSYGLHAIICTQTNVSHKSTLVCTVRWWGEPMTILDDLLNLPNGARFFRADLHIHSYSASHDVKDAAMTAEAIVRTALAEKLDIIAIADHNEISNVNAGLKAAEGTGLLVVPAVELSTPQGHLLCYLPTFTALNRFYTSLSIVDSGTPNSRCQQSIIECLNALGPLEGFGILAHVDAPNGFEQVFPGASPHKSDIICHPSLVGIELKNTNSDISYADTDSSPDRANMGRERIQRLKLGSKQFLARVQNSDSHTLTALGRNASDDRRVTRYKMDKPSYGGLRIALNDPDSRVRIEDHIPASIPYILGMQLAGGFLDGQAIHFSRNMNCIIGGRGTGKSTTFEAVRCLVSTPSESKIVDSEIWPDELALFWRDAAGQTHTLSRVKGGAVCNEDDPAIGPTAFDIDYFGQGEAQRISTQAQTNPIALLNYLDKFIDFGDASAQEEASRSSLLSLQTEIEEAEQKVALIPQYEQLLSIAQRQLNALQKPEVKELIELQRQVATEREVRKSITLKMQEAKQEAGKFSAQETISQIKSLVASDALHVGKAEFDAIVTATNTFDAAATKAALSIRSELSALEAVVAQQFGSWKAKDAAAQKRIDDKRKELEALNVSFDMAYIAKLAKDEASHQQSVNNLKTWVPHLLNLKKSRAEALKQRWTARDRVAMLRETFGKKASRTLREALSDLQVSLKYLRNAHSPEACDLIIQSMGWRTNQQTRASWLVSELTVPELLIAINKQDASKILALSTPEGVPLFRADEAAAIIAKLSEPAVKFALERVQLHDLPKLQVTRPYVDAAGATKTLVRDFSKLSLGQQQSVLLALMLSSGSNKPLIIDQPEDNLDGEFIYKTLVPILRMAKERRQVIVVTHNPNVAVLGDAEQVIVMRARNDKGEISVRGSIDNDDTMEAACAILEGAREAFTRRARMYRIPL